MEIELCYDTPTSVMGWSRGEYEPLEMLMIGVHRRTACGHQCQIKFDMENILRMQFFALGVLLKALCSPEAIRQFESLRVSHSDRHESVGLLLGYGLVIKTILYKQIELIICNPSILGMQQIDDDLLSWWYDSKTKYANRFRKVMRDDAPKSARMGNHINNLLLGVNRSGNDLGRFNEAVSNVSSFAQTVISMTGNCQLMDGIEPGRAQEIDHALLLCAAEYLHDFIYHNFMYDHSDHTLDDAYAYAHANSRIWEILKNSVYREWRLPGI